VLSGDGVMVAADGVQWVLGGDVATGGG